MSYANIWAEYQEELARHHAWKPQGGLQDQRAHKDVHRTNFFKSNSPTKEQANTSTAEPNTESKDRWHIDDSCASLHTMEECSLPSHQRKSIRNTNRHMDIKNRERYRPFYPRGEGLRSRARHPPLREVGGRLSIGLVVVRAVR